MTKYTLKDARQILGMSQRQLSDASGIAKTTIRSIENGSPYKTRVEVAELLTRALGMNINEIEWPRGLSNRGRPPLTGGVQITITTVTTAVVCPSCFITIPVTGTCDNCG